MKVISLYQPWAYLVCIGAKKIETRSFNTKVRGPVLIHASAKKLTKKEMDSILEDEHFCKYFDRPALMHCNRGAIIGGANITDTFQFGNNQCNLRTQQELAFGDYTSGRWGWGLDQPFLLANPVPAKGDLGFWNTLNKKAFSIDDRQTKAEILYHGERLVTLPNMREAEYQLKMYLSEPFSNLASFMIDRINVIEQRILANPKASDEVKQAIASMNC